MLLVLQITVESQYALSADLWTTVNEVLVESEVFAMNPYYA